MPKNLTQLRVDGLTSLQLAELRAAIATAGNDYVTTLDTPSLDGGKVGEPSIISAVIMLAPQVIAAVALWAAKQKKSRTKTITYTKTYPNGVIETLTMDESSYDEGEASKTAFQTFLEKKFGNDTPATS